jgi:signal transduction histidine kinase
MKEKKIGEPGYLNQNCWLVKNLNYPPYKRCRYCEIKFHNCLFLKYQIISTLLIILFLSLSFLIKEKIFELMIVSVFTFVIVYGYFFNKTTDELIKNNFLLKRAKDDLEKINKKLEDEVEKRTKDIVALSQIKTEFLRIVNHQLRTPVSIVKSMLSMIIEGSIKEKEIKGCLNEIYSSVERLESILDDLLTAQELVGTKPTLNLSFCNLEELILKVIEKFSVSAQQKNLSLSFEKEGQLPKLILLDKDKVEKILKKLIDNAIFYTEKGEIKIKTQIVKKDKKEFIQIFVKDTGIGITDDDKKHLFKIFSRGKEAEKIHPNGSGLGLYIVNEYVKLHKGKIEVESEGRNKGTTFIVNLPVITQI